MPFIWFKVIELKSERFVIFQKMRTIIVLESVGGEFWRQSRSPNEPLSIHLGSPPLTHFLAWLTHSLGNSSNSLGPNTGMENANVDILMWKSLLFCLLFQGVRAGIP